MPGLSDKLKQTYNQRLDLVQPSSIRSFDQKVSSIEGLIKLTLGEPDLDTPEHIKVAAVKAIETNQSHYTAQPGTLALRQAIQSYLKEFHQLNYDAQGEIIATVGATEAIYAIFETLINPGDKIIIPTPVFGLYEPIVTMLGGQVVEIDTSLTGFKLTAEALEAALVEHGDAVKAVLLCYPNNPTGVALTDQEVQALAAVIKNHAIFVLSDEIYSDLVYQAEHHSIAQLLPEQTIYISGVSKSYAMTGWRIGFVAGPREFITQLTKVHAFMVTCPSSIDQAAATEAFAHGSCDFLAMREIYRERRDYLAQALTDLGFAVVLPEGAFYLFVKIPAIFNQDDTDFALQLAYQAKVGVIPGSAFGKGGQGYVRLSYASSLDALHKAVEQIKQAQAQGKLVPGKE
ncbi:aminotransferase class I/II-fold pyridoxal phosphate-dependent enzyme [Convivina praedatoris]|uniref:Aminotransferase n=1 Tax=Convivina praedatoris TaxID=2880963 RepID=A0ABN8HF73_9LACO|nr:aminotransferase class I/II-fold pyridoxal phosphate-dependent enzyme [Convivina sp. LMG 32447]CAH1852125.1 putative N-acetyl-LL-diaminopimelate aminotransferase [Convivina sp. LMG 32447]CAH1852154.1 putative N-acetyl-LL-diaminopimelate aminotransferase [Convivina sp. LMG 32447]CAH1852784.1 putative N-acetyl-LL-diaminopimelate aminotransferase [Convivina sp. LMG 32447]